MGHLSYYSKAELSLQSGCRKVIGGITTARCGDYQPDMEMWMCDQCHAKWEEAVKRLHENDQEQT